MKPVILICIAVIFVFSNIFSQGIQFTKITEGDIINDGGNSHGCSWGDYDNDGDIDLYVSNSYNENNLLYSNNGDGTFTKITSGIIVNDGGYSIGCSWGDYDNDSDLDIFIGNTGKNFLYANNSDGTFTKITEGDIVNDDIGNSQSCSWGDFDNDGDLDLFVTSYKNAINLLYINNGDSTFTKITGTIVNESGNSRGSNWIDFDNDGDLDLFVANVGKNFLYKNNGDGTFTKITEGEIVNDTANSSGGSWGDYDNDGDLDLFVANIDLVNNSLYSNNSDGTFTKITSGAIINDIGNFSSSSWGDYDNDGDLDLFVANNNGNNLMYSNNGDGTFTKITEGKIVNDGGWSKGCICGDYDNDGDLDIFVCNWNNQNNCLYKNNGNTNNWLNVKCVGTVSNKSAIGAKVRVKAIINSKNVWQMREISGGQTGLYGQNSLNAEFGLGDVAVVDSIKVEWPSGIVQVLTQVEVNQFLTITETSFDVVMSITGNGKEMICTFGGHPSGTDGFDEGLDVLSSPEPPTYFAYFHIDEFPKYLSTDIRGWISPYDKCIYWTLKILNAEGISTTITWDPNALPSEGSFTLVGYSNINMRTDSSVTFTGEKTLTIQYRPTVCISYIFPQTGWYMISLPVIPEDNRVSTLFPEASGGIATTWDPFRGVYNEVTTIEPQKGYWLPITDATTNQVCGQAKDIYTTHFSMRGWYMIGSVIGSTDFTSPNDNPDGMVLTPAFGWDTINELYVPTTTLDEKKGYWLAVFDDCDLTVGGEYGGAVIPKTLCNANLTSFAEQYGLTPPPPPEIDWNTGKLYQVPKEYKLSQNYPNPFNPTTTIKYQLLKSSEVTLKIFNLLGQEVKTLLANNQEPGFYTVTWDGKDNKGLDAGSGIYLYAIQAGDFIRVRRMLLIR